MTYPNRHPHLLLTCLLALQPCFGLHVSEFGAIPDDGQCDMEAINQAIRTAIRNQVPQLNFDAGTYNMRNTCVVPGRGYENYIVIDKAENLALVGQTDADDRPATRLERNLVLNNDTNPPHQVFISNSKGVTLQNLILTNDPPLGTTARVIAVDKEQDEVVVEVLDGLPAYDGMRAASAHAWDLATGKLKRFGNSPSTATLTIGLNITVFWQAVPGTNARQLKMTGAGFAAKVSVGDGISWHHKATDALNQVQIMRCEDIVFDNILMPNVSNAGILAGYNRNMTFRRLRFEPENGNLAVGGRDGIHLSNTSGVVLIEDCYFKGLRMDPLVFRKTFGIVTEVPTGRSIIAKPGFTIPVGDQIRFWIGDEPQDRVVAGRKALGDGLFQYDFTSAIPPGVAVGTVIGFQSYTLDKGIVRNCVFEGNFGSAIVNFEENITVENCVFRDNSYQIKYGANYVSGAFARNNVFRNNLCEDTSWIDIARRGQPATLMIHSLSRFFTDPLYNQHIEITGNTFRNPHGMAEAAAIDVRNASHVRIHGNVFEGFQREVVVDPQTTRDIRIEE
jgi:hypothetical protein